MTEKRISIVFCGTSAFAVPILQRLAQSPAFAIDLVITQPDRPAGRKKELSASPIKELAQELGLMVAQPEKLNKELLAISNQLSARPDFLVVASYGQLLSDAVLAWPAIAPVNVHPSLLPRWRGATPINHTILAGDTETGTTVQMMVKEMDAGPILAQEHVSVESGETYQHLHDRLAEISAPLLERVLSLPLDPRPQSTEGITICKKLTREDGICEPKTLTSDEIDRKVRGLNPWPGVTVELEGVTLKILEASLHEMPGSIPLPCNEATTLYLVKVQEAGKKPMSGTEWRRGHKG